MRNLEIRLISFKRSPDEPEYIYGLSDRPIKMNDYYYDRTQGRFMAIVRCLHEKQLGLVYPVIEATNNPNLITLPSIPSSVVKSYFESNKQLKTITLRLP